MGEIKCWMTVIYFLIEGKLLYNIVLVSAVQQYKSVIIISIISISISISIPHLMRSFVFFKVYFIVFHFKHLPQFISFSIDEHFPPQSGTLGNNDSINILEFVLWCTSECSSSGIHLGMELLAMYKSNITKDCQTTDRVIVFLYFPIGSV